MAVASPVSERSTVVALLLLTFATGLVDAISVLVLGHVFVANMTGNVIFLGFWFAPHSGVDMTAAVIAFVFFLSGTVIGGRFARYLDHEVAVRVWLTAALGAEVVLLAVLSVLAGTGVLQYHDNGKLILIAGLAVAFGFQNAAARQFGIQELSTTVLTTTLVGIGFDSRLAGGTGQREKLRYSVVLTMCAGATVGATMSRFMVAPVIALAAVVVAASLAVFRYGPQPVTTPEPGN
ncbi:YoaK family protein [Mycolicibacterium sp.]|uniref:YoaK family protein n=1 Tax=Mycolicibacterium sp. TaxID=2320850 RepID=UPI0037C7B8C6